MNKGKVRDLTGAKRKHEMVNKILTLLEKSKDSEVAKSLTKKTGTELVKIYRREKVKRGIPSSFK